MALKCACAAGWVAMCIMSDLICNISSGFVWLEQTAINLEKLMSFIHQQTIESSFVYQFQTKSN